MKKKVSIKLGKAYSPKKQYTSEYDESVEGQHWRAWRVASKYFYEFDVGHFTTKFKVVEVSEEEYEMLKSEPHNSIELNRKYVNKPAAE